jgi:hypothetical protein
MIGEGGALETILMSGVSLFDRVDSFAVGAYTFTTEDSAVSKGSYSSQLGLAPNTLDFTVHVGGAGAALSAFKAAALDGSLESLAVTWTITINGESEVKFTGSVQRAEVSSTDVRIVAASETVSLGAKQLPTHLILPAEFPEIPPPENYNIR